MSNTDKDSKKFNIPSLNGIRALAISLVFVAHAGAHHVVPGGFGVTVFFFLSGYLITTLMRREYEKNGCIDVRKFYTRRIFRIFPPFYAVLALSYLLLWFNLLPGETMLEGGLMLAAHLGNYSQIFWNEWSTPLGTGVYWSLAVEEHFYLGFPMLAVFLLRRNSRWRTFSSIMVIAFVILAWRVWLVENGVSENRTYMASDTRLDSILYGCLLAFIRNPVMDRPLGASLLQKWIVLFLSIIVLLFCFLYRNPTFRETYRYTLQGVALIPIFYMVIRYSSWPIFSWLEYRPIVYFGKISYTFYLIHYVMLYVVEYNVGGNATVVGVCAAVISLGFASLSFHYFEAPITRIRNRCL